MSIEGYVKAIEMMCDNLKERAAEIIGDANNHLHTVDITLHLAANEIPIYTISTGHYPSQLTYTPDTRKEAKENETAG